MTQPTLTPFQAMNELKTNDTIIRDGFRYYMDGPMGSPSDMWAPVACDDITESYFCVSGEPGDIITETSTWYAEVQS